MQYYSIQNWNEYFKAHEHEHLQEKFILTDMQLCGTCENIEGFGNKSIRRYLTVGTTADQFKKGKYAKEYQQIIDK